MKVLGLFIAIKTSIPSIGILDIGDILVIGDPLSRFFLQMPGASNAKKRMACIIA